MLTTGSENRQQPPDVSEQDFVFRVVFAEPRIFQPQGCTYPQPRAGREPCVLEGELSAIYTKAPFSFIERDLHGWGPLIEPKTKTPLAKSIHTVTLFYVFGVWGYIFF